MRLLIVLALTLMSCIAFAQERDAQMVRILSENRVEPWGKRSLQEATLICRTIHKHKIESLKCTIDVTPPGNALPIVYEELSGDKAVEISNLLKEFGIRPSGKKSYQRAEIRCQTPKKHPELPSYCMLIPTEHFWGT